jgi:murein L,D-transpeptidase YafK
LLSQDYFGYFSEIKMSTGSVDKIVVYKSRRLLELWQENYLIRSFRISLGKCPKGAKEREGDQKTPEGHYFIDGKNDKSKFYLNLGISYPNQADLEKAQQTGQSPGGAIKIHGLPNGYGWIGKFHLLKNWTAGCIAITNREMKYLYQHVSVGTPIEIYP